jgi:hypothetical protein
VVGEVDLVSRAKRCVEERGCGRKRSEFRPRSIEARRTTRMAMIKKVNLNYMPSWNNKTTEQIYYHFYSLNAKGGFNLTRQVKEPRLLPNVATTKTTPKLAN